MMPEEKNADAELSGLAGSAFVTVGSIFSFVFISSLESSAKPSV